MNKKTKIRMIVIMPTIGMTVILGGVIYLALQGASASGNSQYMEQVPVVSEYGEEGRTAGDCNFNYLVGQNVNDAYLNLGRPTRVINPGDAVTQDYNPQRVNVHVDAQGYVMKVNCG